jgi:hypothetical protein
VKFVLLGVLFLAIGGFYLWVGIRGAEWLRGRAVRRDPQSTGDGAVRSNTAFVRVAGPLFVAIGVVFIVIGVG